MFFLAFLSVSAIAKADSPTSLDSLSAIVCSIQKASTGSYAHDSQKPAPISLNDGCFGIYFHNYQCHQVYSLDQGLNNY